MFAENVSLAAILGHGQMPWKIIANYLICVRGNVIFIKRNVLLTSFGCATLLKWTWYLGRVEHCKLFN